MRIETLLGATLLFFGCSGGGSHAPIPAQAGAVGTWSIERATKLGGNLGVDLVEGMLVHIDAAGVQVLAGAFVGPGNLLDFVVGTVYGGSFETRTKLLAAGFSFEAVVDLSATIQEPPGSLFQELRVEGRREGPLLRLSWLDRGFAPDALGRVVEVDRLEADIVCAPEVDDHRTVAGTYEIERVVVLDDSGPAHDLRAGDEVIIDDAGVADLFGLPLDETAFAKQAPDLRLLAMASIRAPGAAQGYVLAEGKKGSVLEGLTGEWLADFVGTDGGLQGLYTFTEDDGIQLTDTDDLFLVLRPVGTALALSQTRRDSLWYALPREERLRSLVARAQR